MPFDLLELLNPANPTFYEPIIDALGPEDLIKLTSTCKLLRQLKPHIWNLNRYLKNYVSDPVTFRALMRENRAVISGGAALGFLMRRHWKEGDLDLYMSKVDGLYAFREGLLDKEGFIFKPFYWQAPTLELAVAEQEEKYEEIQLEDGGDDQTYANRRVSGIYTFITTGTPTRKIQIMITAGQCNPETAILSDYYSTHVMNIITADRAYCIFPWHTLDGVGYDVRDPNFTPLEKAHEKYKQRGWDILTYHGDHVVECLDNCCPIRPHRSIGDRFSWVLDLTPDFKLSKPSDICIHYATFGIKVKHQIWNSFDKLHGPANWDPKFNEGHISVQVGELVIALLEDRLTINTHIPSWGVFLQHMFLQVMGEMNKFQVPCKENGGEIGYPRQYLDGLVPEWYEVWEKTVLRYLNVWWCKK